MKSKAAVALWLFRQSFLPPLTQREMSEFLDVSEVQVHRYEGSTRNASHAVVKKLRDAGIVAADDWLVELAENEAEALKLSGEQVLCQICDRRWNDPAVRACIASACPRAYFTNAQDATFKRLMKVDAA